MRVRIFVGENWAASVARGDYSFDLLPAIGHKLVFSADDAWEAAVVHDIAHRFGDHDEAPDIALLLQRPVTGGTLAEPLPLALLDGLSGTSAPPEPVPSHVPRTAGPWGTAR